jgi:DNA gyrase/topoisomerase IV subunit B
MSSKEELERMLLYARALGQGVSFLMTKLLIEHIKTQGNDLEAAMINTCAMLDRTLTSFQGNVRTPDGGDLEISDEIRSRITLILDAIEREAREALDLAPPLEERR